MSSLGGPMRNPHDIMRSPSGSSGGTGIAVGLVIHYFILVVRRCMEAWLQLVMRLAHGEGQEPDFFDQQ